MLHKEIPESSSDKMQQSEGTFSCSNSFQHLAICKKSKVIHYIIIKS